MRKPRIILFDLETVPNLAEVLKVYPKLGDYPGLTLKASITSILCAGYKVLGQKRVNCICAWDFPSRWARNVNDDFMVVKQLSKVLSTADAIITHNGRRFDWKYLQSRLLFHGLAPLPSTQHIDTCAVAKQHLYLFNNRLNTVGEFLTGDKKMDHEGWDLWVKAAQRDTKALKDMKAYCIQDVLLTEKVYMRIRPFAKLPIMAQDDVVKYCVGCGGVDLMRYGKRYTSKGTQQRYICRSCGTSNVGETIELRKPILKRL